MKIRVRLPDGSTLKLNVEGTTTYGELLDMSGGSGNYLSLNKREPLTAITEIAQLAGCRYVLYFEARKRQDLYLWAAGTAGPSAKFLVQQIKPMEALWLTGNCLLGSRPLLSFDGSFDQSPHMRLLKQLLATIFQAPKGHPRSKPSWLLHAAGW